MGLAAAAVALLMLRQPPVPGGPAAILAASETISTLAIETPDDVEAMTQVSTEQLVPSDAESWLLGEQAR
jgi:hypothetical protein